LRDAVAPQFLYTESLTLVQLGNTQICCVTYT